jgi:circadian clock protein KaiB
MPKKKLAKKKAVKKEIEGSDEEKYVLQLFVAGILPNSTRAITNLKAICEKYLKGRYELEVIDIYQQPPLALTEDVLAIPLLIKKFPHPEVRFIGDLSNTEKVLEGLNIN